MSTTEKKPVILLTVPVEIDQESLSCAIVDAVEQSCVYWCSDIKVFDDAGKQTNFVDLTFMDKSDPREENTNILGRCHVVFVECDESSGEETPHTLDLTTINRFNGKLSQLVNGLTLMAKMYPHHFGDLISGNGDATTSDVLIQMCLFGDIRYG